MKYTIVVSKYDSNTKKYKNEQQVYLPDVEPTLQSIDHYTSGLSYQTLKLMIQELPYTKPFTTISIKGETHSTTRYYSIITNNKTLHQCTSDIVKETFPESRYRLSFAINKNNPSFSKELEKFKTFIRQKNIKELNAIFNKNKELNALITRYINIEYKNDIYNEKQQDLDTILREFSRYKNFRMWIQYSEKYTPRKKCFNDYYSSSHPTAYSKHLSPAAYAAKKYNTESWQMYDREEFLTEEDMEQTGLIDDPYQDPFLSSKIKKLEPMYQYQQ